MVPGGLEQRSADHTIAIANTQHGTLVLPHIALLRAQIGFTRTMERSCSVSLFWVQIALWFAWDYSLSAGLTPTYLAILATRRFQANILLLVLQIFFTKSSYSRITYIQRQHIRSVCNYTMLHKQASANLKGFSLNLYSYRAAESRRRLRRLPTLCWS